MKSLSLGGLVQETVISFRRSYSMESVGKRGAGKKTVKQLKRSFSYEKKTKIADEMGNMTTLTEFTLWEN